MAIFIIIGVLLIIVALIAFLFPFIEVVGFSMFPTYKDGEFLHGYRFFRTLKVGDVVVYKLKRNGEKRIVIKRISDIKGDTVYLLGDNFDESYDSRNYGYVPKKDIVCKIIEQRSKIK